MDCQAINPAAEMAALVDAAEARMASGAPPVRYMPMAYSVPAGDGGMGCIPWLSEDEAQRLHDLRLSVSACEQREAAQRIREKIYRRRCMA